MNINDVKEVLECLEEKRKKHPIIRGQGDVKIVVLQRGWVAVGRYFKKGSRCRLENASIIRRWGTTMGLGQLASEGPLKETMLEPSPTIRFHSLTEVMSIDCEESKWVKNTPLV